jgi:hypothetical protein
MRLLVAAVITVVLVLYNNHRGWYSLSEYIGCFGAGWCFGELLNMLS